MEKLVLAEHIKNCLNILNNDYDTNSEVVDVMKMKKDTILILIAVAAILTLVLPKPAGMIIPLMILIPVVIYLIVDIIKNGNNDKK